MPKPTYAGLGVGNPNLVRALSQAAPSPGTVDPSLPPDLRPIEAALSTTRAYADDQRRKRLAIVGLLFAAALPGIVFLAVTLAAARSAGGTAPLVGLGTTALALVGFGLLARVLFRRIDPARRHEGGMFAGTGLAAFALFALALWHAALAGGGIELPLALPAVSAAAMVLQGLATRSRFWFGCGLTLAAALCVLFLFLHGDVRPGLLSPLLTVGALLLWAVSAFTRHATVAA